MNTDVFFTKGSTHKICQDYAAAGPDFVMVSDGCSGAMHTDFGSRLLVRSAMQHLDSYIDSIPEVFAGRTIATANTACRSLGLDDRALFATLLFIKALPDRFFFAFFGDGCLVLKEKSGVLRVHKVIAPKIGGQSSPFYLRYCQDQKSWEDYKNCGGHQFTVEKYRIQTDGKITDEEVQNFGPDELPEKFSPLYPICWRQIISNEKYESAAIMSDGVFSFLKTEKTETGIEPVPVSEVEIIREAMAFKGYQGEFVWRRMTRAFKNFEGKGWKPYDDFSMGVIQL